jgi:hypothetical protein
VLAYRRVSVDFYVSANSDTEAVQRVEQFAKKALEDSGVLAARTVIMGVKIVLSYKAPPPPPSGISHGYHVNRIHISR